MKKFFVITIGFALSAIILFGLYSCAHNVRVVQGKYENGIEREVWTYKTNIFGKKKKIKEQTYYENGNMMREVDIKCDKINGWGRWWRENGMLQIEATYKDNKSHGLRTAYHENGKVFCRAYYEEGELLCKSNWDEEGNEIYLPIDRE